MNESDQTLSQGKHPDVPQLLDRALSSMQLAIELFNRPSEAGRSETVVILLHHSFEMLLKSIIVNQTGSAMDDKRGYSYQFDTCLRLSEESLKILDKDQRRFLSMLDGVRDSATHYYQHISEELLYVYAQSAVTLFNGLLKPAHGISLCERFPRVLPISAHPPRDLHLLVDREFNTIQKAIQELRISLPEAIARLRPLLALSVGAEDRHRRMNTDELNNAVEQMRQATNWKVVFPEIAKLSFSVEGEGIAVGLKIVKDAPDAMPVRVVKPGDGEEPRGSIIYKEVNPLDKFNMGAQQLAKNLGISMNKALAMVREYGIQDDPDAFKIVTIGKMTYKRYSKKALDLLREKLDSVESVWQKQNALTQGKRRNKNDRPTASDRSGLSAQAGVH